MFSTTTVHNSHILKIREKTENFFYGKFYPVILSLLSFLLWFANIGMTGFAVLIFIGCFVLIVYDDMTPTIPLLLELPMTMRNTTLFMSEVFPFLLIVPVFFALLIKFILYPWKKPKLDKLSFAFLGIITTSLTGGLFSSCLNEYFSGIFFLLLTGVCTFSMHFVFSNRIKCPNSINLGKYFCYCFVWAINLASAQMIYMWALDTFTGTVFMAIPTSYWASSNHIANLILLATPLLCYLLVSGKSILPYFINIVFYYAVLWISGSDGCIAILFALTVFLIPAVLYKTDRHRFNTVLTYILILVAIATIMLCYFCLFQSEVITKFIAKALHGNGRIVLYQTGLDMFLENPIFGAGIGRAYLANLKDYETYFHSTLVQVGSTTGIIGLISYAFLYYCRAEKLLKNDTEIGFFAFIGLIAFALYALVDNGDFNVVLIYLTLMITVVGLENEKGAQRLPLFFKFNNFNFYSQFCK